MAHEHGNNRMAEIAASNTLLINGIRKRTELKEDGRTLIYYDVKREADRVATDQDEFPSVTRPSITEETSR
jgi:hypothetical protein